jgi:hypothetical protein
MTDPTTSLLRDVDAYVSAQHACGWHDQMAANLGCAGCELRDRIATLLPTLPAPTDRAAEIEQLREKYTAGLRRADEINNALMEEVQRYAAGEERPVLWSVYNAMHKRALDAEAEVDRLRRMADETQPAQPQAGDDPARIDRLTPEFTEHSSVEAIDAQLKRARAQERRWHLRTEWLIGLRQRRVAQQERGEWPAAGARQDGAAS